jgi:hypothetical protein
MYLELTDTRSAAEEVAMNRDSDESVPRKLSISRSS